MSLDPIRVVARGLSLAVLIALAALFLSEHYGAPAMLFALLIGMAFNFLAKEQPWQTGVDFAATTVLRIGVALLGIRLSFADMASLGLWPVVGVVSLVVATIGVGLLLARLAGKSVHLGLLTGGAVAICGASAALAISAVLPKKAISERDTLFTVVGVTALSTVAMIAYPIVARTIGLSDAETGFLIGSTIHDVAQVVGAGYSVSESAGDLATYVKLQRVALLPVVLIVFMLALRAGEGGGAVRVPGFLIAFIVLVIVNSTGVIPESIQTLVADFSRFLLVVAIAALGIKTSLKAMLDVGPRHALIIVGETLVLLGLSIALVTLVFSF